MGHKVSIPLELYPRVLSAPYKALRNFGCIRLGGLIPFFGSEFFSYQDTSQRNPFVEKTMTLLNWWTPTAMQEGKIRGNAQSPRFIHIDIGVTKDAAGIFCVHVERWETMPMGETGVLRTEPSPIFWGDFLGRVLPEYRGGAIQIDDLMEIVYEVQRRGFWIGLVTFDQYQSLKAIQDLNRNGIPADRISIDATMTVPVLKAGGPGTVRRSTNNVAAAMEFLKGVLVEGRLRAPSHSHLNWEGRMQERDARTGRVEKTPGATDDLVQAMAGAVYVCGTNLHLSRGIGAPEEQKRQESPLEAVRREEARQFHEFMEGGVLRSDGGSFSDMLDDPLGGF